MNGLGNRSSVHAEKVLQCHARREGTQNQERVCCDGLRVSRDLHLGEISYTCTIRLERFLKSRIWLVACHPSSRDFAWCAGSIRHSDTLLEAVRDSTSVLPLDSGTEHDSSRSDGQASMGNLGWWQRDYSRTLTHHGPSIAWAIQHPSQRSRARKSLISRVTVDLPRYCACLEKSSRCSLRICLEGEFFYRLDLGSNPWVLIDQWNNLHLNQLNGSLFVFWTPPGTYPTAAN